MKSYNVIVTVSTTICVDADTPADAIKKVQKMPSRKYRRHLTPTMLGLPCSLAKTCHVLCAMAAIR